jgi:hypothetical protein
MEINMRRMTKFLSLVPVLFVAIGLGACDSAETTGPRVQEMTGPQAMMMGTVSVTYSASRTIGTTGGSVSITDQYGTLVATLNVPASAVRQATVFRIEVDSNRQIHLLASAYSLNDIGAAGFSKPVSLTFNSAYVDPASVRGRRIGTLMNTSSVGSLGGLRTYSTFSSTLSSAETTEAAAADSVITVEMDSFSGYGPTTD